MTEARRQAERRKPRAKVDDIVLLHRDESDHESAIATLQDISHGGIGIIIEGDLKQGDVVSISLALGSAKHVVKCKAIVRHAKGKQHGLEFLDLTEQQIEIIREACVAAGVE